MRPRGHGEEEVDHAAIYMSHGEEAEEGLTRLDDLALHTEGEVACEVVPREHDTLAEARRT